MHQSARLSRRSRRCSAAKIEQALSLHHRLHPFGEEDDAYNA